jgi:hypothetical protein
MANNNPYLNNPFQWTPTQQLSQDTTASNYDYTRGPLIDLSSENPSSIPIQPTQPTQPTQPIQQYYDWGVMCKPIEYQPQQVDLNTYPSVSNYMLPSLDNVYTQPTTSLIPSAPPLPLSTSKSVQNTIYPNLTQEYVNKTFLGYGLNAEVYNKKLGNEFILCIDDSGSNQAFDHQDNRIGQIIEAGGIIVDLVKELNLNGTRLRFVNCIDLDTSILTPDNFKQHMSYVRWEGGTFSGIRIDSFVREYFENWNKYGYVCPLNLIYIGDGKIDDQSYLEQVVINSIAESANRGIPTQVKFEFYLVGDDEEGRQSFIQMDDTFKNIYGISSELVDVVYHTGDLKFKIIEKWLK